MKRLGLLSTLALAGASVLLGACDEDLLNPMSARQPRIDPYKASEFYDDGLTMREPPAGTVPRERVTGNPAFASGRVVAANGAETYVTSFPLKVDRALLELGRRRYDITCGTCHGPVGDGESIVAHQMGLRPPPSLIAYAEKPVGYLYDVATRGFGFMASYAAELPPRERWAVIAYIRALQVSQTWGADKLTPDERAQVEAGAAAAATPTNEHGAEHAKPEHAQ